MVFFFLVSAYVFNPDKLTLSIANFVQRQASSRLVPYVFFSQVLAVSTLLFKGDSFSWISGRLRDMVRAF